MFLVEMVVEWVFFHILMNATMAPLGIVEKFKVKIYTGFKFEICLNRGETCTNIIPRIKWTHNTFPYFRCIGFELFTKKGQDLISIWIKRLKFIKFGLNWFPRYNLKNRIFMTTCYVS